MPPSPLRPLAAPLRARAAVPPAGPGARQALREARRNPVAAANLQQVANPTLRAAVPPGQFPAGNPGRIQNRIDFLRRQGPGQRGAINALRQRLQGARAAGQPMIPTAPPLAAGPAVGVPGEQIAPAGPMPEMPMEAQPQTPPFPGGGTGGYAGGGPRSFPKPGMPPTGGGSPYEPEINRNPTGGYVPPIPIEQLWNIGGY